jgi:hypothetical protein
MASLTNSHISTLIGAGADAMSNMFEVTFSPPGSPAGIDDDMRIRVKSFTPPAPTHATYDVHWKTVSRKMPAAKIELDREVEFEIRIDAYYAVYKRLLQWQALTAIPAHGYASNSVPTGGSITVSALSTPIVGADSAGAEDNNGLVQTARQNGMQWVFEDAWITNITPPAYNADESSPVSVTVKFAYGKYKDPQTSVVGIV